MRTFSRGPLARGIAYLLSFVFLWSFGFIGAGAVPASAQVVTKGATTQSVAVVPFQNRTKLRIGTLGDEAADAVAVELRDRLLLDVFPKADVSLQMRDLSMTPPLTDSEVVRLATELDVSLVVTGEVRGARIVRGKGGRFAEVILAVRLFDRVARADVNGALVSAVSPTSDESEDVLIQKALQQAAFTAVQQMKSRPTVTAMVLWAREDVVFLNVGTRGGIRPGMKLVAVRGGERIGLAKVTEADAIGSYATLTEGPPLRTGDNLRAVYEVPTGMKVERVGVATEQRNRFEKLAIAGAVLLGLGNFANRARRVDEGNTVAPGFNAANIANGADFGFSGFLPSFHANFPNTRDLQPCASTTIDWGAFRSGERKRVVGFVVQRDNAVVDVVNSTTTRVLDMAENPGFRLFRVVIDIASGTITEFGFDTTVSEDWTPTGFDQDTGEPNGPTFVEFVNDHSPDAGFLETEDTIQIGWFTGNGDDIGGIQPADINQYSLAPIILEMMQDGSWDIGFGQSTTALNFVRGVVPAGVFSTHQVFGGFNQGVYEIFDTLPNPEVVSNQATFFFYYPFGADDIVLQIARDPNRDFVPPDVLSVSIPPVGPNLSDPTIRGGQQSKVQVELSQVPGSSPLFFWRISARSFDDTHPPRSYPVDDPALRGFVHSVSSAFLIVSGSSRASMVHEQREALDALRAARARVPRTATADRVHRAE